MNILSVENISKSFGEKLLFENVSFGIESGQKVALIARNGAGKTSLLNILLGRDTPDTGKIVFRNGLRIACLEQNPDFSAGETVIDSVLNSDNPLMIAIREYELAALRLRLDESAENHEDFHKATTRIDELNAWDAETRVKEVLGKLGIEDINQPMSDLSGGQRRKVALSKVLLEDADFLLLDEPTNHLDIAMIEWLESLLTQSKLSLLVVTHDRYFLDNVCDDILELENYSLQRYRGNYNYYLEKKAEREFQQAMENEKVRNLYFRELEWMRRMPSARTTKSKARQDNFYRLQEKARQRATDDLPDFRVASSRVGNKILEINNIHKSFGTKVLLDDFSYTFKKGERIGIVGPNGCGKTTFFNMVAGQEKPDKGRIVSGQTIVFGYYRQDNLINGTDKRLIDLVKEVAEEIRFDKGSMSAAQFLNYFGFSYTTQYNYYQSLSGGERRRLHLLLTLMQQPNFLILDEPTNDLDLHTLRILESFLAGFDGCLMIASHDRAFLDQMVDHIFVFTENGKIDDYHSTYTEYREKKKREEARQQLLIPVSTPVKTKKETGGNTPKASYKQKMEHQALEAEIADLEKEKGKVIATLSSGLADPLSLQKLSHRLGEILALIDTKTERWMELDEIIGG